MSLKFSSYKDAWKFIRNRMSPGKRNYILLDEIQLVPDFERVVDELNREWQTLKNGGAWFSIAGLRR